jgi:hypothetical protein
MATHRPGSGERGIALLVTLVAISLVSVIGMALVFSSSIDRLAASNHDEAVELLNLADAALELVSRDLAQIADWSSVLDGTERSPLVDGPSSAVRYPWPGLAVDLPRLTGELTCGNAACSGASRQAVTIERPWGANNPVWQPFLHLRLALPTPSRAHEAYVVVWLGDDGSEADGDPWRDGGGPDAEGRYILRARAEAFGRGGARRAIEAELARICTSDGSTDTCLPGVGVHGWRLVSSAP